MRKKLQLSKGHKFHFRRMKKDLKKPLRGLCSIESVVYINWQTKWIRELRNDTHIVHTSYTWKLNWWKAREKDREREREREMLDIDKPFALLCFALLLWFALASSTSSFTMPKAVIGIFCSPAAKEREKLHWATDSVCMWVCECESGKKRVALD